MHASHALNSYRFACNRREISAGIRNRTAANTCLDSINYMDTLPLSRTAVPRYRITFYILAP